MPSLMVVVTGWTMNVPYINRYKDKYWYNDKGEYHREDGPAIEWSSGYKQSLCYCFNVFYSVPATNSGTPSVVSSSAPNNAPANSSHPIF